MEEGYYYFCSQLQLSISFLYLKLSQNTENTVDITLNDGIHFSYVF